MFLERIEPVFDRLLGCCREIAALDIVHRKEIHVAKQASAIFDEGVEIFLSVVDILDEKIFEGPLFSRYSARERSVGFSEIDVQHAA